MASAQTQIRSELPDPLACTTIPTLTIYRTHQHTTPDSSTRMVSSKSRSTHRNTIPTLTIYRTHQHTTPNSSTRMVTLQQEWLAQNQDQHIGTQGAADLCTPNQINKTRTVSCLIYNAHHPDCNRSFR
jgi:hypothetical protein